MTTTHSNHSRNGSETRRNQPAHEIRMGRVKATIWENSTGAGIRHNVTVTRLYRDDGKWKDSMSFGRDDLPVLAKVLDMAHTWIYGAASTSPNEG